MNLASPVTPRRCAPFPRASVAHKQPRRRTSMLRSWRSTEGTWTAKRLDVFRQKERGGHGSASLQLLPGGVRRVPCLEEKPSPPLAATSLWPVWEVRSRAFWSPTRETRRLGARSSTIVRRHLGRYLWDIHFIIYLRSVSSQLARRWYDFVTLFSGTVPQRYATRSLACPPVFKSDRTGPVGVIPRTVGTTSAFAAKRLLLKERNEGTLALW